MTNTAKKLLLGLFGGSSSASAFVPADISGLVRYHIRPESTLAAATDGTGAVSPDGNVAYWEDLSTSGAHAKQSTASAQPLWRDADAVMGDCLDFVSTDTLLWDSGAALAGDFTIACVVSLDAVSGTRPLVGASANETNYIAIYGGTALRVSGWTGTMAEITGLTINATTRYIITLRRSGGAANNITAWLNGTQIGQMTNTTTLTINQIGLRGTTGGALDGRMSALLVYTTAATNEEVTNLNSFLAL